METTIQLRPVVERYLQMFQEKPFENVGITITSANLMLTFPLRGEQAFEQNFYENLTNEISFHGEKPYFYRNISDYSIYYGKGTKVSQELTSQEDAINALDKLGHGKFQEKNRLNKNLIQIYQNIYSTFDTKQLIDGEEVGLKHFRFRMTEYRLEYRIEFLRHKTFDKIFIQNDCIDYKYSDEAKQFLTGLVQNTEITKQ